MASRQDAVPISDPAVSSLLVMGRFVRDVAALIQGLHMYSLLLVIPVETGRLGERWNRCLLSV